MAATSRPPLIERTCIRCGRSYFGHTTPACLDCTSTRRFVLEPIAEPTSVMALWLDYDRWAMEYLTANWERLLTEWRLPPEVLAGGDWADDAPECDPPTVVEGRP